MVQVIPQTPPDYDASRVIERPNGFFWQSKDGKEEYGPFETLLAAVEDMSDHGSDSSFEPGESLAEAEDEIGIADWIDPETGMPAEDGATRIEDH